MRQPAVFFGHGSPMNALGGPYGAAWRDLGQAIGKPRGVVMVAIRKSAPQRQRRPNWSKQSAVKCEPRHPFAAP